MHAGLLQRSGGAHRKKVVNFSDRAGQVGRGEHPTHAPPRLRNRERRTVALVGTIRGYCAGRAACNRGSAKDRGQTGLPANFRQTAPEIHGSLVSPRGQSAITLTCPIPPWISMWILFAALS